MVHPWFVHVKVNKSDLLFGFGKNACKVGRNKTLSFLRVQRRHEDHIGTFLGEEVLQVRSQRPERLCHSTPAVGAACDGVIPHVSVVRNASNDRRIGDFTQFGHGLNPFEEEHACHCKCEGNQEADSRVGQDGAALVWSNLPSVTCALNQRGFRGDACASDDGGGLPFQEVHGEFLVDAQFALHGKDVTLGLRKAGQPRFEFPDVGLQIHATTFDRAKLVGEVHQDVASNVLGA